MIRTGPCGNLRVEDLSEAEGGKSAARSRTFTPSIPAPPRPRAPKPASFAPLQWFTRLGPEDPRITATSFSPPPSRARPDPDPGPRLAGLLGSGVTCLSYLHGKLPGFTRPSPAGPHNGTPPFTGPKPGLQRSGSCLWRRLAGTPAPRPNRVRTTAPIRPRASPATSLFPIPPSPRPPRARPIPVGGGPHRRWVRCPRTCRLAFAQSLPLVVPAVPTVESPP